MNKQFPSAAGVRLSNVHAKAATAALSPSHNATPVQMNVVMMQAPAKLIRCLCRDLAESEKTGRLRGCERKLGISRRSIGNAGMPCPWPPVAAAPTLLVHDPRRGPDVWIKPGGQLLCLDFHIHEQLVGQQKFAIRPEGLGGIDEFLFEILEQR